MSTPEFRSMTGVRSMANVFPFFTKGKVVKGFGRGSKELGIPTANFPSEVVESLPADFGSGIYYGWATVDDGPIHKMVMSVGWNPHFKNTRRSMETHIMETFQNDFYGSLLKVCVAGFIRKEQRFDSVASLIAAIRSDIAQAEEKLELPVNQVYREDSFFIPSHNKSL